MTTTSRTWLTEQAHQRLQDELSDLVGLGTGENVLDFDRKTARIQQIQDILRNAVIGEVPPDDGIAEPGMVLTVRFDEADETLTFLLGGRDATDELQTYSPGSPLGAALVGAREGEQCTYTVPSGATMRVTLLRAVPYGQHA